MKTELCDCGCSITKDKGIITALYLCDKHREQYKVIMLNMAAVIANVISKPEPPSLGVHVVDSIDTSERLS